MGITLRPTVLRACYAMSSTDIRYAALRLLRAASADLGAYAITLRAHCAMSGTDLAYGDVGCPHGACCTVLGVL
eukprot:3940568-Rhodomonas_salina.1